MPSPHAGTASASPSGEDELPRPAGRRPGPLLTIGMATYDDYDGVYFSLQALRMFHAGVLADAEFVIVDNRPDGPSGEPLRLLARQVPGCRYVANANRVGTAVRDEIFAEARGDIVLSMDCHVLFDGGALDVLLDYFAVRPLSRDLIQGPLLWDNLDDISSHWEPIWSQGMFGKWATSDAARDLAGPAFEIPLQGLGVFACRKSAWPGFNPAFVGFGGEEGYIHEKFRQRGDRALCLPGLRWLHRFARPLGVPYPINWDDRFRNYLLGRQELGLPVDDVIGHMTSYVGTTFAADLLAQLEAEGAFSAQEYRPWAQMRYPAGVATNI